MEWLPGRFTNLKLAFMIIVPGSEFDGLHDILRHGQDDLAMAGTGAVVDVARRRRHASWAKRVILEGGSRQ